jgi:hypothetical protein
MSRRASASSLVALTVVLVTPCFTFGQTTWSLRTYGENPMTDSVAFARAKFEASRSTVPTLRQEIIETARQTGNIDLMLQTAGVMADLHRGVLAGLKLDDVAILEGMWDRAREVEDSERGRYNEGRIPAQEFAQAKLARLYAEMRLTTARTQVGKDQLAPLRGANHRKGISSLSKENARQKFEAAQGRLPELKQARVNVARSALEAELKLLMRQANSVENVFDAQHQLLMARSYTYPSNTDRVEYLEARWQSTLVYEDVCRGRFEAGRIPVQVLAAARFERWDAELELVEAIRKRPRGESAAVIDRRLPDLELIPKDYAKRRAALTDADVSRLAEARRDSALVMVEAWMKLYLAGAKESTWAAVVSSMARLAEAELATASNDAERSAALEKFWANAWAFEQVNEARYKHRRVPKEDFLNARLYRLEAELRWAEARAKAAKDKSPQ